MRIYLDDVREPPKFNSWGDPIFWDKVCRRADEVIELVKSGVVTFISFDHDLGTEKTGYTVAKAIEELAFNKQIPPIDYAVHSANPIGAMSIDVAMKKAWHYWES